MRVKRYIVDTMPEAMLHIRKELGSDAVILSSKEIKVGGIMGLFTKKKIEVIAAVDKEEKSKADKQASTEKKNTPVTPMPRNIVPQAYKKTSSSVSQDQNGKETEGSSKHSKLELEISEELADRERSAVDLVAAMAQNASGTSDNSQPEHDELFHVDTTEQSNNEVATSSVKSQGEAIVNPNAQTNSEQKLLEELREMKEWIAKLSRQSQASQELPTILESVRDQFSKQGVSDLLSERWLLPIVEQWNESGKALTDEQLRNAVLEQIESFLDGRFGGGIKRDTRIVYVAGPTGVGKTTTIAKLAAEQLFKYQRKVGFITSDTYRISAVEQLRTYASILNVPLEVVQSPGDMRRAMHRLEACDLILMDTAGRNYRNELLVAELQSLLTESESSETYLVLSLTSKSSDMVEITNHFSKFGLDKVILTKLDETGSYGSVFDLLDAYPLKLSYMTNGQNVPDDLLMPDTVMLSKMLLGERWI